MRRAVQTPETTTNAAPPAHQQAKDSRRPHMWPCLPPYVRRHIHSVKQRTTQASAEGKGGGGGACNEPSSGGLRTGNGQFVYRQALYRSPTINTTKQKQKQKQRTTTYTRAIATIERHTCGTCRPTAHDTAFWFPSRHPRGHAAENPIRMLSTYIRRYGEGGP